MLPVVKHYVRTQHCHLRCKVLSRVQVPKVGRRFVKPDDIAFIDETEYAPKNQAKPPYNMRIDSILPLLGDRVRPASNSDSLHPKDLAHGHS